MARGTLYLPVMIAAAVLMAGLVALLAVSEEKAQAAFPGKNGRIAFSASEPGSGAPDEIFTIKPDGMGEKQLTARR